MTNVGKQNLKFLIEKKERELNEEELVSNIVDSSDDNSINKITFLNTQINDIKQDVKLSVRNMINNVSEMKEIDSKSAQIKDTSYKFQQDASNLERKLRIKQYLMKAAFYSLIGIPILYVLYKIFK